MQSLAASLAGSNPARMFIGQVSDGPVAAHTISQVISKAGHFPYLLPSKATGGEILGMVSLTPRLGTFPIFCL